MPLKKMQNWHRLQLNWWGNGLEIWLLTTYQDLERLPFQIEVPGENKLKVAAESQQPSCYVCSEWSQMKVQCPKYKPQHDKKDVVKNQSVKETSIPSDAVSNNDNKNGHLEITRKMAEIAASEVKKMDMGEKNPEVTSQ